METTNTKSENKTSTGISFFVIDLLVLIGLVAEYFGLKFYISQKEIVAETFLIDTISVCIVFMLIHHFFIIKNFNRIDHMTREELIDNGFGNWVIKSRIEKIIRIIIFGLFACLTGEIVYLLTVYYKNADLMSGTYYYKDPLTNILEPKTYDLTWITTFYISSAFVMSCVMFGWDIIGKIYDKLLKPLSDAEKRIPANKFNRIVAFPLKDPFWMFFISDGIALWMWWSLKRLVVDHDKNSKYWLIILFVVYSVVIIVRVIGSAIASWPMLKSIAKSWNKMTFRKFIDGL